MALKVCFVPSALNPADLPLRALSYTDCKLSSLAWKLVQQSYGPLTLDLFAFASNVQCDQQGNPLRFYAPFPNPGCSGVNVFAQTISPSENAYAFPPFVLMGPLLESSSSLLCPAPSLLLLRIFDLVSIGGQFSEKKRPATLKSLPRARQTFFFSQIFTSMAPSLHALYNGIFESSVYLSADCSFLSPSTASSCSTSPLVSFGPMSGMQYPNDADFSFCQRCGYKRSTNTLTPAYTKLKIDLSSVDKRLASIRAQRKSLPYERQKSALKKKLETFLGSLPSSKTLQSATPHDLTRFLVWKDGKGKTKVHVPQCPLFGSHSKRFASAPLVSPLEQLITLLANLGRFSRVLEETDLGTTFSGAEILRATSLLRSTYIS